MKDYQRWRSLQRLVAVLLAWGMVVAASAAQSGVAAPATGTVAPTAVAGWVRLPNAPQARRGSYAFGLQGKAYIVSGMGGYGEPDKVCWQYDPASAAWTVLRPYPGKGVVDGAGFAIGGRGYVVFGHNNNDYNPQASREVWEYNPANDSWRQRSSFPGEGRTGVTVVVLGGKAYCFGGKDKDYGESIRELWEYDPAADTWTRRRDPPAAGFMLAGFGIGQRAYFYQGDWRSMPRSFMEYDAASDSWQARRAFPGIANGGVIGFSLGRQGYLCSGNVTSPTPFVESREVWRYDPAADAWTRLPDSPMPGRAMANGIVIGQDVYLGLGSPGRGNYPDWWGWRP